MCQREHKINMAYLRKPQTKLVFRQFQYFSNKTMDKKKLYKNFPIPKTKWCPLSHSIKHYV